MKKETLSNEMKVKLVCKKCGSPKDEHPVLLGEEGTQFGEEGMKVYCKRFEPNHTKTLSEKKKHFVKLPESRLPDRLKSGYYYGKDVKEKIQNAQKRIKKKLYKEMKSIKYIGCYKFVEETINKIFKEEFGDKLIK